MNPIHLDHQAATPLTPAVRDAFMQGLEAAAGSPGGVHAWAESAADMVEEARARVAALVAADPGEIVFTSGPVESRVLAVTGLRAANTALGAHAVASRIAHPAVEWALRTAEAHGQPWSAADVDSHGQLTATAVAAAVRDDTSLLCLDHGHHDVGAISDVAGIVCAVRARRSDARVFVDATATVGRLPVDVTAWDADAVAFGGPAMGLPGWVGMLWLRPGARLQPMLGGGAQEHGRRAGAEDLAGICAAGAAADAARARLRTDDTLRPLTERLWQGLAALGDVRLNGPPVERRVPGNLHVSVGGVTGETLAVALAGRGVAVSPGSACGWVAGKASPVLEAMGVTAPWSHCGVLLGLAPTTSADDIDAAVAVIGECVRQLRAMSLVSH